MIMLVYWESMVWSIIAHGIVYVKYIKAYKIKLMFLNGRLFFRYVHVGAAMIHVLRWPMGGKSSATVYE